VNNASSATRVVVIIPTYNEIINLPLILQRVRDTTPDVDILVVDDSSPDGTGELADTIAGEDRRVHVLHRAEKNGLGGAYLAGFAWARSAGYDVVVEMDADGSHRPEDLHRLLDATAAGASFVIGSRWVEGGRVVNWPRHRKLLSLGGNVYARLALGTPVRDITGGYRAIRMAALDQVDLSTIGSAGYCFQVDLAWRAILTGVEIVEVPITFVERVHGESKMSLSIVLEAFARVALWAIRDRTRRLRTGGRRLEVHS
jgi:dolichol-phosphate mannosyltransferase